MTDPARRSVREQLIGEPPSVGMQIGIATTTVLFCLIGLATLPFAAVQLTAIPQSAALYGFSFLITEGSTAFLLFSMGMSGRSRRLILLACAYLYSAIMALLHIASFRGAVLTGESLIGGPQSVPWLFVVWKLGFGTLIIGALLVGSEGSGTAMMRPVRFAAIAAGLTILACVLAAGILCGEHLGLSHSTPATDSFLGWTFTLSWVACGAYAMGGVLAAWKAFRRDTLCLWLALAMFGFAGELVLSTAGGARFTLGWYVGRASGVLGGCVLFLMFLTLFVRQNRALAAALSNAEMQTLELKAEIGRREEAEQRLLHAQKMEALGQLAGGVAHDLNNVLQAVQGGISLIKRRPADGQGRQRLLQVVLDAAERGAGITRRLLAFSHRSDIRPEPVQPAEVLSNLRELLIHTLGSGIGVRLQLAPGLQPMFVDKGQLETVLINLATNARDAMDGNGVLTLDARMEVVASGVPHPAELIDGTYICLSVTDTGVGMPPEILSRITEPFFTTKEPGKGTGLGLAMARGFAEQSGGALHAESKPGAGATIRLWFPVAGDTLFASTMTQRERSTTPGRVLLVDDDPLVREIVAQELRSEGYITLTASEGQEALKLLEADADVDILISDLSMPGMDGLTVIGEAQRRRPRLPAILLTGYATAAAEAAMASDVPGLFSLLRKPVSGPELAEQVELLLEGAAGG